MARPEIIDRVFQMLLGAYPAFEINKNTPGAYHRMLQDLDDEVLEAAVLQHISSSKFFPTPHELRDAAANIELGIDELPPAMEAWGQVVAAMNGGLDHYEEGKFIHYGMDNSPCFDNPVLAQTVEAMGWRRLCLSTNEVSDRARFIETYNTYLQRGRQEAVKLPEIRQLAARLRAPGIPAGQIPSWIEINQKVEEEM